MDVKFPNQIIPCKVLYNVGKMEYKKAGYYYIQQHQTTKRMSKCTKNINPWSELHIVYLKMLLWWPFQIFMADT